uniref:Ras-associating domain-containing protein n=2 Tax=Octopus bimaculoides TaxID=37653 RepID=A0A0L8G6Q9_OCTBM|eukprot:XP_014783558.1 PREDICTED: ras association domain-containing protein 5-like [Octopus bimaculoides]
MSLGARPPSIYEVLTREHIVEQNTQSISFYMPRDTVKSIHVDSETTTKEVIAALLKKFKILDNPRKFAMYEQEFKNKKLVKLRRVMPEEFPLQVCLGWETNKLDCYRLVLQENEASGDIEWSNFSNPELNNFVKVLDREESEHIHQLQYKYHMMKKAVERRMKELRAAEQEAKHSK